MSKLRPFIENDDTRFPRREARKYYDFGDDPDAEWVVASIEDHKWGNSERAKPKFLVQWELGDQTWESLASCQDLAALDKYLELMGVESITDLPRK